MARGADRLEVVGVDDSGIVQLDRGSPATTRRICSSTASVGSSPRGIMAAPGVERPRQDQRRPPLLGRQAGVAAREGQAVGLTDRRAADDLSRQARSATTRRTRASCWKSFSPK